MGNFAVALDRAVVATIERLLVYLPQLLGALTLLLVGWLLARLLRLATRRGASLLDSLIARSLGPERWHIDRSASVLGTVVYWVVLLFFVAAATHTLGLQTFTDWLARLLDHLPTLAAGLLIVAVGYVLSGFVAELVRAAATALAPPQRAALARVAQGATLAVALLVGAEQVGLKVTWIAILAAVLLASVMGGVTLAVSLGARSYVANLIGAHYLRQALQLDQRVRVAGHEGRIVDVTVTSLVLETDDGRVVLPGRVYHDEAIVLIVRRDVS
ncbi:MAG: mechanosensitive ion channel [Burkholderiaceae bacterium]|nr:mechanosensitive ion channel [Burkholderiaceae bacterium]MDH3460707.1 mechanosensitive ion channel [Burkholderiaceae bacterium]